MSSIEQVEPLIAAKCTELGFEFFEARFFKAGTRSIMRIFIDTPNGVTIGDCERMSNEFSVLLDVENFSQNQAYTLEVSSPGIDRPLKTERDFNRIRERDVTVHLAEALQGSKTYTGTVQQCNNNILFLLIGDSTVEIPLTLLLSGKEAIRFK